MKKAILITGGAGYIGSHTTQALLDQGRHVIVLDDLSTGHKEVTDFFAAAYGPERFAFVEMSLLDAERLKRFFQEQKIEGIIDFAAKSIVGASQESPRQYFENNVLGFSNLLQVTPGIPIVKSSTAATYGDPPQEAMPLTEKYQAEAIAQGRFKTSQLMPAACGFKELLAWYEKEVVSQDRSYALSGDDLTRLRIATNVYGINKVMDEIMLAKNLAKGNGTYVSLRYFNAGGAAPSRMMGEDHNPETHLIPIVLQVALGKRAYLSIFGDDYPTKDGTAIRDYISVNDLARAHVLCLDHLISGGESRTYNLGTSQGYTVREILNAARAVTRHPIPEKVTPRRSGDPTSLIADASLIQKELAWKAEESLEGIIASAWHWQRLHPNGFYVPTETRYSPFWDRWVNIAAHRNSRPWSGATEKASEPPKIEYDPKCYLCPGNTRANGETNPHYTGSWSFKNDFPTLKENAYEANFEWGAYRVRSSYGICEVITYSPNHSQRMATMEARAIEGVVSAWTGIYERLRKDPKINYVMIFENRGEVMGNSQPHPHGQVYAFQEIPDLMIKPQLEAYDKHRAHTGNCFVCDAIKKEKEDGRRVLIENGGFTAFVPFSAMLPYDVIITSNRHIKSLSDLRATEQRDLASLLKALLHGLDGLFGVPYQYSLAIIQEPTDGKERDFHLQIHISSLLCGPGVRKHVVGVDIFGMINNPKDPNLAAFEIKRQLKGA